MHSCSTHYTQKIIKNTQVEAKPYGLPKHITNVSEGANFLLKLIIVDAKILELNCILNLLSLLWKRCLKLLMRISNKPDF